MRDTNYRWLAIFFGLGLGLALGLGIGGCQSGSGSRRRCGEDGGCPPVVSVDAARPVDGAPAVIDAGGPAPGSDAGMSCVGADCVPPEPPSIASLMVSRRVLYGGEADARIEVSVLATDPNGVTDLAGGVVEDAARRSYATLEPRGGGTFVATLSWAELHAIDAIDFDRGGETRQLRVRVLDAAGHEATEGFSIELRCHEASPTACGGRCVDLQSNEDHCGRCGRGLPSGQDCVGGVGLPACDVSSGLFHCGMVECVDTRSSGLHCGRCDRACPPVEGLTHEDLCYEAECQIIMVSPVQESCDVLCSTNDTAYTECIQGVIHYTRDFGSGPVEGSRAIRCDTALLSDSREVFVEIECVCEAGV